MKDAFAPLASLIGLVFLVHAPALHAGFVWDDNAITGNPLLKTAAGLWTIWIHPARHAAETHYWPLTYTTFWLERHLWGLHPAGYHFINLALHAVNVALVWLLLRRWNVPGAWLAAALFATHPVHAEPVSWAISRKDLLSAFFYLCAFRAFDRFEETGSRRQSGASLLFYLSALLSKSSAVTFPAGLLVWMWWRKGRLSAGDLRRIVPFLAVGAIYSLGELALYRRPGQQAWDLGLTLADRLAIAGHSIWSYAGSLAWPNGLTAIYPKWAVPQAALWKYAPLAGASAVIPILWLLRVRLGRAPLAAYLFFAVTLGPALGLIPYGYMLRSYTADRFLYLASAAPLALAAGAATNWALANPKRLRPLHTGTAVLLLALGILTWRRCLVFENGETLYRDILARNPVSPLAHNNLGWLLLEQSRPNEALDQFQAAMALDPAYPDAVCNLGIARMSLGRPEDAIRQFEAALRLRPDYPEAHFNLANALAGQQSYEEARRHYQQAIAAMPDFAQAHNNLGALLLAGGDVEGAIREFSEALQIDPDFVMARGNLAEARSRARKVDERR